DRKQPQAIETFQEVARQAAPHARDVLATLPAETRRDVAANTTVQSDRLVVLVLDDLHTWRGRTDTVRGIARTIVGELGGESSMALIQTGGEHGVEVTQDRSRLLASIDRFTGRRPVRRPNPECNPHATPRDPESDAPVDPGCDIQDFNADMGLYKALEDAARILGGTDHRRKAFVLVSENVAKDLSGLFGVSAAPDREILDGTAYVTGGADGMASMTPSRMSHYDNGLLQTMDAMRRGGVATYAIDPRGEVTSRELMEECQPKFGWVTSGWVEDPCEGGEGGPADWTSWVRQAQHGLEIMSDETGGFAVVNSDDFTGGVARIVSDLDNYYLLGFRPSDTASKDYRKVDVEVKGRPDLTLRYRRGYMLSAPPAPPRERDALAALVDGPLPARDLPMRLHAVPMPYSNKEARVAVAMEISVPRREIEAGGGQRLLDEIRFGFYAIDLAGAKVREQFGRGARIGLVPARRDVALPDEVTYEITTVLQIPPGQYQIRASATSDKLGKGGSAYLSLEVPDFSKQPLAVTDLVLAYADGPHVPIARTQARSIIPAANVLPFDPTLDRTFGRSDTLRLFFRVLQRRPVPATATVSALGADGRVVLTLSRPLDAKGSEPFDIRLPLAQLAPGAYRLQVRVTDGRETAGREIGIAIR
ncbi:MAG: VWA domain-containing protein, partial [Vicinamibacterales bacterium]